MNKNRLYERIMNIVSEEISNALNESIVDACLPYLNSAISKCGNLRNETIQSLCPCYQPDNIADEDIYIPNCMCFKNNRTQQYYMMSKKPFSNWTSREKIDYKKLCRLKEDEDIKGVFNINDYIVVIC